MIYQKIKNYSPGLRFKFVTAVSLILLLTLGTAAWNSSRTEQQLLKKSLNEKGQALGKFIALISPEAIYAFDITTLDRFVQQISDEPEVLFAQIRTADKISMTTFLPAGLSSEKVQEYIDQPQNSPYINLLFFPITDDGKTLGEVVIAIDTSELQRVIQQKFIQQLLVYLAIIIFLAGVIFYVFRFNVLRPVKALMNGAHQVSQGDFDEPVTIYSQDELGRLAECFNHMIGEIKEDREELVTSNLHLEQAIKVREKVEKQLRMVSQAVEQSPNSVLIADSDGQIEYVNTTFNQLTGYSSWEVVGKQLAKQDNEDDKGKYFSHLWQSISSGTGHKEDFLTQKKDGQAFWEATTIAPIRKQDGSLSQYLVIQEDVSQRKESEKKLQLAASVFTHAREGISITDSAGTIIEVNDAFCYITGYTREEAEGKNPRILRSGRHGKEYYKAMWGALINKGHWYGEIWNKRKNGDIYPEILTISAVYDSQHKISHYVALFTDITEQKRHQQQLERTAHYDALTNLPNRVLLADRMRQSIAQLKRHRLILAVVYLDLDGFKEVNDNYGHEVGDQLLIRITGHLKEALREGDTIARIGGDEFVAVLNDLKQVDECQQLVHRLNTAASQPVHIGGRQLQVSASIGVSFCHPDDEIDAEQLVRQADQAMYQAKLSGKNRYHIFDSVQDRNVRGQFESIHHIQDALRNDEFVLYYQPKVNMASGELVGVEALIRWQHPERGLLLPGVFLPIIEESPIAIEIGEWVIRQALRQMSIWKSMGLDLKVSVNVGAKQLQQANFVEQLQSTLKEFKEVASHHLELEILETSALEDIRKISEIMHTCSNLGVNFALDDFGTGYSSLTYLKRLPASQLKIDRSFVQDMLDDPEDLAILEGVLGLATAFRREAIAEGVESEEHGYMLLQLGCNLAQGFAIARPMPAAELPDWLENWQPYPSWQKVQRVEHADLSLLFAMVEHRAWVRGVEECVNGERIGFPVLDETQCRFSDWLNGEGKNRYGNVGIYSNIDTLHSQVHHIATEILQNTQLNSEQISKKLRELRACRDQLISHLIELVEKNV